MVCAETSKRFARSSTITRPKARAILRISFWRWVSRVTATPRASTRAHGAAVPPRGQRRRTGRMASGEVGDVILRAADRPHAAELKTQTQSRRIISHAVAVETSAGPIQAAWQPCRETGLEHRAQRQDRPYARKTDSILPARLLSSRPSRPAPCNSEVTQGPTNRSVRLASRDQLLTATQPRGRTLGLAGVAEELTFERHESPVSCEEPIATRSSHHDSRSLGCNFDDVCFRHDRFR